MRRPKSVLSSSLAALGLSASVALAQQQSSQGLSSNAPPASQASTVDSAMAARPTRFLLRNGLDYLAYHEYARALSFLKAAEARQAEMSPAEIASLKRGISQAQQGMREAVNSPKVIVQGKGRVPAQPGSFALARPAKAPTDTIQLASVDLPTPPASTRSSRGQQGPALPTSIPDALAFVEPAPVTNPDPSGKAAKSAPALPLPASATAGGIELPPLPDDSPTAGTPEPTPLPSGPSPSPSPSLPAQGPTVDPSALPAQSSTPLELPSATLPPPLVLESSSPAAVELPTVPTSSAPADLPSVELPQAPTSPPLPMPVETAPSPVPVPVAVPVSLPPVAEEPSPRAAVAEAGQLPDAGTPPTPTSLPEPPPAAEAPPASSSMPAYPPASAALPTNPQTSRFESLLPDRLRREVEQMAQGPGGRAPGSSSVDPNDPGSIPPSQGSPRLAIERAPSPTEARPLRRVATPEEFVNLGKREWDPNRKYWAAAGTCHMILYFQDPVLERYGQGVEQSLGPWGRYFSYPLDDPKQSNQRNQILQPFYSMGKFCFQVGTLPYKMVVDPPWEAEYDLGYYRPGDRIPADTIYITPFGVGPPGKGRNY